MRRSENGTFGLFFGSNWMSEIGTVWQPNHFQKCRNPNVRISDIYVLYIIQTISKWCFKNFSLKTHFWSECVWNPNFLFAFQMFLYNVLNLDTFTYLEFRPHFCVWKPCIYCLDGFSCIKLMLKSTNIDLQFGPTIFGHLPLCTYSLTGHILAL